MCLWAVLFITKQETQSGENKANKEILINKDSSLLLLPNQKTDGVREANQKISNFCPKSEKAKGIKKRRKFRLAMEPV